MFGARVCVLYVWCVCSVVCVRVVCVCWCGACLWYVFLVVVCVSFGAHVCVWSARVWYECVGWVGACLCVWFFFVLY